MGFNAKGTDSVLLFFNNIKHILLLMIPCFHRAFFASAFLAVIIIGIAVPLARGQAVDASQVFKQCNPWIVTIIGCNASGEPVGQGSGFFLTSGDLVTSHHVLAGMSRAFVYDANNNKLEIVSVVSDDPEQDLVKVRTMMLRRGVGQGLALSTRVPEEGEVIIAIGSPKGLSGTISEGIVSAIRRDRNVVNIIQTTAATSPGSSGCPLLNLHGEVVGIVETKWGDAENVTFATPVSYLAALTDEQPTVFAVWSKGAKVPESAEDAAPGYYDGPGNSGEDPAKDLHPRSEAERLSAMEYGEGAARFNHRDYRGALPIFERAAASDSMHGATWFMIGTCHYALGQAAQAAIAYQRAGRLLLGHLDERKTEELLMGLAQSYFAIPKPDSALKYYRQVLTLDPDNPLALVGAGRICISLDKDTLAYSFFEQAAKTHGDVPEAHFYLGITELRWDRLIAADSEIRIALSLEPDEPEFFVSLAEVHWRQGLESDAKMEFRKALALYTERHRISDADDIDALARLLLEVGLVPEATEASDLGRSLLGVRERQK